MSRFVLIATAATVGGWLSAAPVPPDAKALVAKLGDPSPKVRDEAAAALRGRPDAAPWLRRAARSVDRDTARRAVALLALHEPKRQAAVAKAIDACIRNGQVDLFMEWHHYWQPESKDDLWPVGPRMIQVAREEYDKWSLPPMKSVEQILALDAEPGFKRLSCDSPAAEAQLPKGARGNTLWSIRTDRWPWKAARSLAVAFGSVAGPVELAELGLGGRFFALGPIRSTGPSRDRTFAVCDGEFFNGAYTGSSDLQPRWGETHGSFVACRGDFRGEGVFASVLLVDGDVELFDYSGCKIQDSLIRASGEIRIPKTAKIVNSKIEAHVKNATAPYKFFELADVGLSLADDEEGLVVTGVKADTPFGNSGIAKGDLIRAIDDAPAGHSEAFRKFVRRALVRQGDCLVTVARGNETLDLAVHFPLPK